MPGHFSAHKLSVVWQFVHFKLATHASHVSDVFISTELRQNGTENNTENECNCSSTRYIW